MQLVANKGSHQAPFCSGISFVSLEWYSILQKPLFCSNSCTLCLP
uniref:Uncharacterized protein n=1 Tax=Anguilla anguilla TaxID=7936 RepID=A0A0E9XAQ1_ANGAN